MKCPHCKKEVTARVQETRHHRGSIYRARCCPSCGKRFITLESAPVDLVMPSEVNKVKRQQKKARRVAAVEETPKVYSFDALNAWHQPKEPT